MSAVLRPSTPFQSLGDMARHFPDWVQKNVITIVITAAISGAVAYGVNVWLMAVRYEGSITPQGAPATSKSNFFAGGLFWAVFPMVLCSIVGYWRTVGNARFWRDVRRLPMTLVGLFRRDGAGGWVHLLWGSAIALAASLVVPPAVGAVLGIGLLVSAPSVIGSMVSSLGAQAWRQIAKVFSPTKDHRVPPVLKVAVGLMGWAVALLAGFLLPGLWIRLVLSLSCAAAAYLIGRQAKTAAATVVGVVLVLVAAYAIFDVLLASPAFADDGGFAECGSTLRGWISHCSGAATVRKLSLRGAIIASGFGPIGYILGGLVGTVAPRAGGGNWWDDLGLRLDDGSGGAGADVFRTDWPAREDGLPTGPRDPVTGEPLVTNDGRWADVPIGHVYANGAWVHPEAIGAVGDDAGRPLIPEPALDGEDGEAALVAALIWLPPLAAASALGLTRPNSSPSRDESRRRSRRSGAENAGGAGAAAQADIGAATRARGEALVAEARDIQARLDDPNLDDAGREELHAALRTKAIDINADPTARALLQQDTSGTADLVAGELDRVYDEVAPRFVDRMNAMGMRRDGRPLDIDDLWEIRQQSGQDIDLDLDISADADGPDLDAPGIDGDADDVGQADGGGRSDGASGRAGGGGGGSSGGGSGDASGSSGGSGDASGSSGGGGGDASRSDSSSGDRVHDRVRDTDGHDDGDSDGVPPATRGHAATHASAAGGAHRDARSSAPSMRSLWKRKKKKPPKNGRIAIDVDTYGDFLVQRLRIAVTDDDKQALQTKIDRLEVHRTAGVTSVLVSPSIWNDVAQHAYSDAYRDVTGADAVLD